MQLHLIELVLDRLQPMSRNGSIIPLLHTNSCESANGKKGKTNGFYLKYVCNIPIWLPNGTIENTPQIYLYVNLHLHTDSCSYNYNIFGFPSITIFIERNFPNL